MYPKTPGYFSDLSSSLCCKSYCFFLKLLVVFPIPFSLLHFTPPKVLRLYCNLTFRCVRYFGGSSNVCFFIIINSFPNLTLTEEASNDSSGTIRGVTTKRSLRFALDIYEIISDFAKQLIIFYRYPYSLNFIFCDNHLRYQRILLLLKSTYSFCHAS